MRVREELQTRHEKEGAHRAGVLGPPRSSALIAAKSGRASGSWSQQLCINATRSSEAPSGGGGRSRLSTTFRVICTGCSPCHGTPPFQERSHYSKEGKGISQEPVTAPASRGRRRVAPP